MKGSAQRRVIKGSAAQSLPTKRTPQQQRALARVDAILAATEAVVAEGGYENLTMLKIAARAGITHTSIYHYFTSVEAILTALISRLMGDFDRGVFAIAARAETAKDLIEAFLQSVELGFQTYRSTPVARGLWAATRYLPALRKIDDEDSIRIARLFSNRFKAVAPHCDHHAVYITLRVAAGLAVPTYETALSVPKSSQRLAMESFLAMVRSRLAALVLLPRRAIRAGPSA